MSLRRHYRGSLRLSLHRLLWARPWLWRKTTMFITPAMGSIITPAGINMLTWMAALWVSRPAPMGVSADVLLASPSVKMDFHDSPANHHEAWSGSTRKIIGKAAPIKKQTAAKIIAMSIATNNTGPQPRTVERSRFGVVRACSQTSQRAIRAVQSVAGSVLGTWYSFIVLQQAVAKTFVSMRNVPALISAFNPTACAQVKPYLPIS